ncbi:MAG TPA: FtsX-like permease family protein [Steroidobacteraceae bacterium]|nr:FtsX-like permease family protein [Steroidobacteraceae bacterium]
MRNYLAVLFRNLRRERLYAAINIAGLALGIACCLILGLFLKSEFTYDQHFKGHEHIYRAVNEFTTGGANDKFAFTSNALGPMMAEQYPQAIKTYVRFQSNSNNGGVAVHVGDKLFFWEHSYFVDPNVFEVFTHKILYGDPKTALQDGANIAISESVARKYFGNENPIGKLLTMDSGNSSKISLVFADLPANTHLKYDLLFSNNLPFLRLTDNPAQRRRQLTGIGIYTYFVMTPSFRVSDWKRINDEFVERNMKDVLQSFNATWRSWLQPLREVHLQTEVQDTLPGGNRMYLLGCAAVALIILVIACINYMNLATARATRRARSIGIRKILGASRGMLAMQFLGEAILFALLALVLAAVVVEVVLRFTPINALMGQQVSFNLIQQPQLALWLLGLALVMGLVAGAYPAIYLSSWAPLTALTGKQLAGKGNLRMREFLVLLQFTISATSIACTLLMMAQMHYIANKPLGFEKHNRMVVTMRGVTTIDKHDAIRNELLRNSSIHGVAVAAVLPGQGGAPVNVSTVENEDGSTGPTQLINFPIGENMEKVLGLQIKEGRDLSSRLLTDTGSNMLVNEALVRKMGWKNALGKRIQVRGEQGRVVGVVKDFNFKSLHTAVEPMVMYRLNMDLSQMNEINRPFIQNYLVLDIAPENIGKTLSYVEGVMANADPKHPFEYKFLDAQLDALYKGETALTKLIAIFAAVSIFIACMGLFGLAAFPTEQRTREIGTRKVLGATSWQIVRLLARPVMILVGIASVLAAVLSWFAIDEWLTSFANRTGINWVFFALTLLLAGTVAFVTVTLQSWKTASADPVNSLRFT